MSTIITMLKALENINTSTIFQNYSFFTRERLEREPNPSVEFSVLSHYENMPMQYTEIFKVVKMKIFSGNFLLFFLFLLQNIDCGYSLEPPRRGGSNEYPQSMFWSKNMKK